MNSKTRMCVLGCGRATGWAALVPGHRLWLGFTLAPLSQILCCYLLRHISTYLHIYRATLCVYQERGGGGLVCSLLTRTRKPRTFPPGFPVLVWAQSWESTLAKFEKFKTLRTFVPRSSSGTPGAAGSWGRQGMVGTFLVFCLPQPSPAQPSQS